MKSILRTIFRNLREIYYWAACKPKGVGYIMMMHHILQEGDRGFPQEHYLNITPQALEKFLADASRKFDFISLAEVPNRIKHPQKRLFMAFTLDDGCQSVYTHGLPIFQKYRVPFTIYVTTGFVGGTCDNSELQNEKETALTWEQLMELKKNPLVTIGGHTDSHPKLTHLSIGKQRDEIKRCVTAIKELLHHDIATFAYPFGDEDKEVIKVLHEEVPHIQTAVLATGGAVSTAHTNFLRLPRINLANSTMVKELYHWRETYMGFML